MNSNKNPSNFEIDYQLMKEDIDVKKIVHSLSRYKKLILKFSLFGPFAGSIFAFTQQRVWQGEFQIVLEDKTSSSSLNGLASKLSDISLIDSSLFSKNTSTLNTEIGILESPSVLMNIFDFVKEDKIQRNNQKFVKNKVRFQDWKNDLLDIKLQDKTTILNISYRDKDKDLVLPVLNRISNVYQDFSGRKRLRSLELGMNFYKDQISLYKTKSLDSFTQFQKFIIENDFYAPQSTESDETVDPLQLRTKTANKIRQLNQQLTTIKSLEEDSDQITYIASDIGIDKEVLSKIYEIEERLAFLRLNFKENFFSLFHD